jgi:hypothetical protein
VFTCGSDVLFTNFDINIEDFANNYISIAREGWNKIGNYSLVNGEIVIFNKIDNRIFDILDSLITL